MDGVVQEATRKGRRLLVERLLIERLLIEKLLVERLLVDGYWSKAIDRKDYWSKKTNWSKFFLKENSRFSHSEFRKIPCLAPILS